ncbi:VanW family protein [Desulfotomaculum nigrificans CO-1-SRB]|uniref:VanW family protein n=1 Tax=Desulfotomaculum nigrificans (strain DSM 14880 / VKM B-2319 / CO-1-SRB) TaxID=868595 RepID=F6B3R4_DESCC|nr:VanW family protein [Desulfotomaculum nigrificans]AEF95223.1 VanW family protein [Desulfotomaculum nigrificans CO-1-SRB]
MKRHPLIILLMITGLLSLGLVYGQPAGNGSLTTPGVETEVKADDIYNQFKGMDKPYQGSLPWEENTKFKATIAKYNAKICMAAYKATLHDPLPGEEYNIALAADLLAGKVVQPGEIFSQNNTIGPYTEQRGYRAGPTYAGTQVTTTIGGGVCKIASLLYNVVTFSNMPVVMRSAHSMTVPYVPPGQDATVYYGVKDFRFLNDTGQPVVIWAQKVGHTLYMALYGSKVPPTVTWHHQVLKRTKYWTEYRQNYSLAPGEERVVMPGMEGLIVRSWVTIKNPDGQVSTVPKGLSCYNASPCIIERGPGKVNRQ